MEPCRSQPSPDFLKFVREKTREYGVMLIFDEVSIAWRLNLGGAHLKMGVAPDMAVFAKAMGNGHPIGAIIGTREAMASAHTSFISSTYWTESVGPTAALATIKKMQRIDVPSYVATLGQKVMDCWDNQGQKHGLPIESYGLPCMAHFAFKHELASELRTLYTQLMLERGFLAGVMTYSTLGHTDEIISLYCQAIDEVFGEMADILDKNAVLSRLKGPVAHSHFARLTD
jgi:glutamate-1-semialdehyde 2,1-aminomutase